MLVTGLLLIFLSVATVTDVRSHTIANWTVYPGILLALVCSLAGTLLGKDTIAGTEADVLWYGVPHLSSALGGLVSCGLIMLVCYVFFPGGLGGGDVKLIAMMGSFLGVAEGLEAMLWTFVLGGCVGLISVVWQVGVLALLRRGWVRLRSVWRARTWVPLTDQEREPLKVHLFLSPAALVGVIIVRFPLWEQLLRRG